MSVVNPALLPSDLPTLYARHDRIAGLIDRLSGQLDAVEARIHEIEEARRSDEPTGFRAMYAVIK